MERVTGIGGVFFKARDVDALKDWYREHLGFELEGDKPVSVFRWYRREQPDEGGSTTWALFTEESDYLGPSSARFMVNYRVESLDRMLQQLKEAGVEVEDRVEQSEFGRFGWAIDPEGNRFELWEPPEGQ
jgi:catechol 2,3-dioxygenase-like lactoylglutathione lyase family enzyme